MFRGQTEHSIDDKNRLTVPAKFREELGETFFVTKGLDNCLFVFSGPEWEHFEEKLRELPMASGRASHRFFFSGAAECAMDKQGRILLPANLKEYASITKDVVIVGVSNRLEIWDKGKWESYNNSDDLSSDEIASQLELLNV